MTKLYVLFNSDIGLSSFIRSLDEQFETKDLIRV